MTFPNWLIKWSITGTRLFLGIIFFTAGMSKLLDGLFPGIIGPVWLEERLAEYGLGMFARFVAYSQVIVGLLLLSMRFATLGAVMLFPLILNIWMVTVSMEWKGTPYVNFFLLSLNIFLLIADFPKLKFILSENPKELEEVPFKRKYPKIDFYWGIGMFCVVGSTLFWKFSGWMTYSFIGIGLLILLTAQLWQNRVDRRTALEVTLD